MINKYIDDTLDRKNRGVYFKKGKWLLHLSTVLVLWAASYGKLEVSFKDTMTTTTTVDVNKETIVLAILMSLPFLAFFYFYCLYLIPRCFKKNNYRKFWTWLILLLLIIPLLDYGIEKCMALRFADLAKAHEGKSHLKLLWKSYVSFIGNFVGFTSMLYLMELMEGIRTTKEIDQVSSMLLLTERNRVKTRMDPDFMMRSLDGIIQLAAEKNEDAPDSVIRFSDVLRYRLYRSAEKLVLVQEELQHLETLLEFQNTLFGHSNSCTLEVQGSYDAKRIQPLSLVNIAEALLNTYDNEHWSLLLYLLFEEQELQMAVELVTGGYEASAIIRGIEENLRLVFGDKLIFATEKENDTFSIRICLPLHNNSNA